MSALLYPFEGLIAVITAMPVRGKPLSQLPGIAGAVAYELSEFLMYFPMQH
jgi:hypothetical protein